MTMRDQMPTVAAFIDALRDAFGRDAVDPAIRAGTKGKPDHFHATEAGHQVGTPFREPALFVPLFGPDRDIETPFGTLPRQVAADNPALLGTRSKRGSKGGANAPGARQEGAGGVRGRGACRVVPGRLTDAL